VSHQLSNHAVHAVHLRILAYLGCTANGISGATQGYLIFLLAVFDKPFGQQLYYWSTLDCGHTERHSSDQIVGSGKIG